MENGDWTYRSEDGNGSNYGGSWFKGRSANWETYGIEFCEGIAEFPNERWHYVDIDDDGTIYLPGGGCYVPDDSYNIYSDREIKSFCKFMLSAAFFEIAGAQAGAIRLGKLASRAAVAAKGGVELTAHGAERIAGAAATRGGVLSMEGVNATKSLGRTFS